MPKKKDMSYAEMAGAIGRDFWNHSDEMKAVRAVGRKARAAYNVGRQLVMGDDGPKPGSKEAIAEERKQAEQERVSKMGSAAWAKAKKKAGIRE